MQRPILLTVAIALGAATGAAAHAGHVHKLMGTVKAVHAEVNHVEIATPDGKTVAFHVTSETRYSRRGAKAAFSDLTVGTRVVVDTRVEGDRTVATLVRLGAAPKPSPAKGISRKR